MRGKSDAITVKTHVTPRMAWCDNYEKHKWSYEHMLEKIKSVKWAVEAYELQKK